MQLTGELKSPVTLSGEVFLQPNLARVFRRKSWLETHSQTRQADNV